ncbi:MAG: hypothetical protein GY793_05865 [Proteobacteria bacterium]|nr:hypothetical protein [Pseudomonadota bacterium]
MKDLISIVALVLVVSTSSAFAGAFDHLVLLDGTTFENTSKTDVTKSVASQITAASNPAAITAAPTGVISTKTFPAGIVDDNAYTTIAAKNAAEWNERRAEYIEYQAWKLIQEQNNNDDF